MNDTTKYDIFPSEWIELVKDTTARMLQATSYHDIYSLISSKLNGFIPMDSFYIDTYDYTTKVLDTVYIVDRINDEMMEVTNFRQTSVLTDNAKKILNGESVLILRKQEEIIPDTHRFGTDKFSASLMFVPIKKKDDVIGIMSVQSYEYNAYNHSHLDLLALIANQAAIAIENISLTQESYMTLEDLALKSRIIDSIRDAVNLSAFLKVVVKEVGDHLNVRAASVFMMKNKQMIHKISYIDKNFDDLEYIADSENAIIGEVIRSGHSYFTNSIDNSQNTCLPEISSFFPNAFAGFPIFFENKLSGILALYNDRDIEFPPYRRAIFEKTVAFISMSIGSIGYARRFAQSEIRFKTLVENANDIIFTLDTTAKINYASSQWNSILGYDPSECLGKSFDFFIHGEDISLFTKTFEDILRTGDKFSRLHIRLRHKNGSYSWQSVNGNILLDADKKIRGILGICRDVTSIINLESQLKGAVQYYKNIFYYTPVAIFSIDSDGFVTSANDAAIKLFFNGNIDPASQRINCLTHPGYSTLGIQSFFNELRLRISVFKENITFENYETKQKFLINVRAVPLQNDSFDFEGAIILCEDMTERKKTQDQIIQSQKLETIGQIAGGIAHDFNNILSGVLGYASLIKNMVEEDSDEHKYITNIISNTEKASFLTDQLLGYAGAGKYAVKPMNINQIIIDTLAILKSSIGYKIVVDLNLDKNLYLIEADQTQMRQIITNLCLNASESIVNEGRISISTSNINMNKDILVNFRKFSQIRQGYYIKIEIKDTGIGMDEETLKNSLELFFSTKGIGRGLGLPAVQGIVENHHGAVIIDSLPKKGTTISIYLPAAQSSAQIAVNVEPAEEVKISDNIQKSPVILVVDDEEHIRDLFNDLLIRLNYSPLFAANGEQAIEIFSKNYQEIDIVILDILMPGKNGFEVLHEIEMIDRSAKVLFVSGYDETAASNKILKKSKIPFLHKPFTVSKLQSELNKLLSVDI